MRAVFALLLAPLGCGLTTYGLGDGTTTGPSPSAAGTTSEPPTTTSEPPTTTTQSTGADEPTTGTVGNCELAPECEAGGVEAGAQCDSCGVQRRTCQADCTWTALACEQDLDTCAYWRLPTGAQAWERVPVDPGAAFAPKDPVITAFALAPQHQIYVLTASSYHILDSDTQGWVAAGGRDDVFPELAGRTIHHAIAFTTDAPDTILSIVADTEVFGYTFVAGAQDFTFDAQTACCGSHYEGPNAPPDPYAVRGGWGRLGNVEGWIPGDVQALCPDEMPTELYGYNVSIGDGFVYPQDIGYCFDFYPPIPFDQFLPLTYPGRPDNQLIAGAAWVDGLWIFR